MKNRTSQSAEKKPHLEVPDALRTWLCPSHISVQQAHPCFGCGPWLLGLCCFPGLGLWPLRSTGNGVTVPLVRSRRSDGLGIPLGQGKAQEMGSSGGEARRGDGAWISHLEWVMPSMQLGSWGPAWGEKVSDASPWRLGHKSFLSRKQWRGS